MSGDLESGVNSFGVRYRTLILMRKSGFWPFTRNLIFNEVKRKLPFLLFTPVIAAYNKGISIRSSFNDSVITPDSG